MSWWSTLQFGYAFAGAVAVLTPLLVLAYLKQQRARRKVVSSVLILRELSTKPRLRRRFVPPPRFFLELLCLLLLALAAMLPSMRDDRERVALVIDTSLSMRAFDTKTAAETRLAAAVELVERWIDTRPSGSRFTLYTSAPRPERVGEEQMSESRVTSLLSGITAHASGDSLEVLVNELAGSGDYDRLFVVTDRTIERGTAPGTNVVAADGASLRTIIESGVVGSKVPNPYVSGVRLASGGLGEGGKSLVGTVALAGQDSVEVTVTIAARSANRVLRAVNLVLQPDRPVDVPVSIPGELLASDEIFAVTVAPRGAAGRSARNALEEDDTAWISLRGGGSRELLLVRSGSDAMGLDTLEGFTARAVSPEEFDALDAQALSAPAVIVYHAVAPRRPPERPSLFVLPPAEGSVFPVRGEHREARVSSWLPEHPITSYLNVPLLRLPGAVTFDVPLWAQPVISSEQGPVVVAGESRGVRLAATGFEILPFEGARTPTTSILTLNLLSWLLSGGGLEGSALPGTVQRLDPAYEWSVRSPRDEPVEVTRADDGTPSVVMGEPGVYSLTGKSRKDSGERSERMIVNVLLPDESQTVMSSALRVPDTVEHQRSGSIAARPLWPYVAGLVLLLLFAQTAHRSVRTREA